MGVTNEYFRDHAQRIMELKSIQGSLDMQTRRTLEKFILKYINNANIAFKEMQNVGKNNILDKKNRRMFKSIYSRKKRCVSRKKQQF